MRLSIFSTHVFIKDVATETHPYISQTWRKDVILNMLSWFVSELLKKGLGCKTSKSPIGDLNSVIKIFFQVVQTQTIAAHIFFPSEKNAH